MPLVTCKDCSAQVSDKAHSCPHCGRPFLEDKLNQKTVMQGADDFTPIYPW